MHVAGAGGRSGGCIKAQQATWYDGGNSELVVAGGSWGFLDPGGESCRSFQSGMDVVIKAPVGYSVHQEVAPDGRENWGELPP